MELKLKHTKDYILLVDVKPTFIAGDYLLEKNNIINIFPNYLTDIQECDKIIGYLPKHSEAEELDLPLLPEFSINSMSVELSEYVNDKHTQEECIGFIDGYNVAQKKGIYTKEDMHKMYERGRNDESDKIYKSFNETIEEIEENKLLPREFIPEVLKDWNESDEDYEYRIWFQTTSNTDGKTVLVGEYRY